MTTVSKVAIISKSTKYRNIVFLFLFYAKVLRY